MHGHLRNVVIATCLAGAVCAASPARGDEVGCMIRPERLRIEVPDSGFVRLDGTTGPGPCDEVPPQRWLGEASGRFQLLVAPLGPEGSGRFWTITVGLAPKGSGTPGRGFCLETSTAGWRTLRAYRRAPLPWVADLDGDGHAELIVWGSFPLDDDPTAVEYGLVGWAYRLDAEGAFTLDWRLSGMLAAELAEAYHAPAKDEGALPAELREIAARELARFANDECSGARAEE